MPSAVVTGATGGIGREIARGLAARGFAVTLAVRNGKAARPLAEELGAAVEEIDLASLASVRAGAARLAAAHPRLDLLVNNAGLHTGRRTLTADGLEETLQVNHVAPFLLTNLLLPNLRAAGGRVTNVASAAHRAAGALDLPFLEGRKGWSGFKAYAQSKLCNILHARELARREPGIKATCAHPGSVRTGWGRGEGSGLFRFVVWAYTPLMISPARGALSPLAAATEDVPSGSYVLRRRVARPNRHARSDEAARALWTASERWSGIR